MKPKSTCSLCQIPIASPHVLDNKPYCQGCAETELPRLMREKSAKSPMPPSDEDQDDWQFMDDEGFYSEYGFEKY